MGDLPPIVQKYGIDTGNFKTGIAAMNWELRVLESGFRGTAAGMGDWSKNSVGLEARIKSLNSKIEIQQDKVSATRIEYERMAAEKGKNSVAAQNLEIKLNKETETLANMEGEPGDTEKALGDMGKETGQGWPTKKKDAAQKSTKLKDALAEG